METLIVLIGAALLIGCIVWWFFGQQPTTKTAATVHDNTQAIPVVVRGGYTPAIVVLQQGIPARIIFDRQDPSGCFNEVVLPDFGIHTSLPINTQTTIEIDTSQPGEYSYSCGMNMFHGKIVIR
ncbi:MAG: cupredoxin domain-containing protein [Candidatus Saccharimonadales bacterium]